MRNNNEYEQRMKRTKKIVIVSIIGILIFSILLSSFYVISAGERGIVLTFGNPTDVPSSEGLHFKIPIAQKVIKIDVKTQKYETPANSASKDLQVVSTTIAVNYHLVPETTPRLYQEIGLGYSDRIIQPAVQEVVKASTAKFTAEELITKRPEVKEDIQNLLRERLQARGIIIEDVSITNFDFSASFNEAIEAKVTAEQQRLKAINDLERIKVEAEQVKTRAQAEAEALTLKNRAIQDSPDVVKLKEIEVQEKAIEKWNGQLPQVTGGAIPFISIDNLQESS